jgi:hypothetical protein
MYLTNVLSARALQDLAVKVRAKPLNKSAAKDQHENYKLEKRQPITITELKSSLLRENKDKILFL